ncbi:MAG: hypothetical protein MUF16_00245 [Burkholderiaceae bacterium]|nr:hypothetical protein [Burkholderiaceae bacterium]
MATSKSKASTPEVEVYEVISTLIHGELVDGQAVERRYEVGEQISLTAAQAAPLLGHTVAPVATAAS